MPDPRLQQYANDLQQEVNFRAGDHPTSEFCAAVFTEYVLEMLEEHNEASGAEVCYHNAKSSGTTPAAKLHAWSLSGDGATLDLFVTLYHGLGETQEVGVPDTRQHFKLLLGFLRRAYDGFHKQMEESSDGYRAMQQIYSAKDSLATVRLFFLTDGVVRSLDVQKDDFPGLDVKYAVWDLDNLSRLRVGDREVIELDFVNDYGGALSCLETQDATGEYRTFLAFVPAKMLARIYGEHGQRLLERNVRAFLQAKGKVNRGLQKTLKEEPNRFLAYNNGLCCTAAEVKVQAVKDGHVRLEWVRDFQIVNGGQTTASIFHAMKKLKVEIGDVTVQVKLTVLSDPSRVSEIVPLISLYANSQNKVNSADFSASGPYHHGLEQLSRTIFAPATNGLARGTHWYYERARGSFVDDKARQGTPAKKREWDTKNPPHQKFTKTDLAKFQHSWSGLPHLVCLGADKNFLEFAVRMEDEGAPVIDENYFKQMVAKGIIFRTVEKLFSVEKLEGYRVNSVAYAVAWLVKRSGQRIDLMRIWQDQRISTVLFDTLKIVVKAAHAHINDCPDNPGEWSKKDECWNAFRERSIPVGDAWRDELSETAFIEINSEDQALEQEWERIRPQLVNDFRTLGELEALTGKVWIAKRRNDPAYKYLECSWQMLRGKQGMGLKKLRGLVEIMSAATRTTELYPTVADVILKQ